jgi:hypothetical protein
MMCTVFIMLITISCETLCPQRSSAVTVNVSVFPDKGISELFTFIVAEIKSDIFNVYIFNLGRKKSLVIR